MPKYGEGLLLVQGGENHLTDKCRRQGGGREVKQVLKKKLEWGPLWSRSAVNKKKIGTNHKV